MTRTQTGFSVVQLLLLLVIVGFVLMMAVRFVPVYIENHTISSVLDSLSEEPNLTNYTEREMRELISRRFSINGVESATMDDVEILRTRSGILVTVRYEVRHPFLGNLDLVARFNERYEVNGF